MHKISLLLAASLLIGACSSMPQSSPLISPCPVPVIPESCRSACRPLPTLASDLNAWAMDVLDAAGECLRLHETCRSLSK